MKTMKKMAKAAFSITLACILSLGLAPLAFAAETAFARANVESLELADVAAKRSFSFAQTARDISSLDAGTDYVPGVLLVMLDGDAGIGSDGETIKERAAASIAARKGHLETFGTLAWDPMKTSPSELAKPAGAAKDGLGKLGDMKFVAAGNWLGGNVIATVAVPEGMDMAAAVKTLVEDDRVVKVSLDYCNSLENLVVENAEVAVETNDPLFGTLEESWHLSTSGATGAWGYMNTPNGIQHSSEVTVVVIDTGCDLDHPDLVANLDLEHAYDAFTESPLTGERSSDSHGTHVCGIISAEANNNLGVAGVSYNAKVLPISAYDPSADEFPDSVVSAAFEHVFDIIDSGDGDSIRVVNMSFAKASSFCLYEDEIERAATQYDLTLVAAAGNEGVAASMYPAAYEECISVININILLERRETSNYGLGTDICAPGVDVWSTVDGGGYATSTGTSVAAPVVSGVAALLYSMVPDATSAEVRNALISTTVDIGAPGPDSETANGLVNAADALELLLFGVDYSDVVSADWYVAEGYLTYAITHGLMKGYSGTALFGPGNSITRAEFATVLYRIANPNSQATTNPAYFEDDTTGFTDAVDGEYFTAAINWAKTTGIMQGDSVTNYTTVRPNDPLNRQEAAVMAQRFAGVVGVSTSTAGMSTPSLPDWSDVESWAQDAMKWCYHRNVISGWDNRDGTYSALPLNDVSRSMMTKISTVLHRDVMP